MKYDFIEDEYGCLKLFQRPLPGASYTIGIDASTGLGKDNSAIQVLCNILPFEQVAVFRANWPVTNIPDLANKMGHYYNDALIVCEINYPGNSVQDALLQTYQYPRNYQPESHLMDDINISHRFGFLTTEASKWILIQQFQLALQNKDVIIRDSDTIEEMMNFVFQESRRKTGAAEGFNDDLVIAMLLAYNGAKLYPITVPKDKPKPVYVSEDPDVKKSWRLFNEKLMRTRDKRKGVVL